MLSCNLQGGLGNQMFQIFTTLATSLHSSLPFYFIGHQKLGKRNTYWSTVFANLPRSSFKSSYVNNSLRVSEESWEPMWKRYSLIRSGHRNISYDTRPLVLDGYFQNENYFKHYKNEIFEILKIRQQQSFLYQVYKDQFDFANSIALHFRRDDYKTLREYYHLLPVSYYANALHMFLKSHKREKNENTLNEEDEEGNKKENEIKLETNETTGGLIKKEKWKAYIFYQLVDQDDVLAMIQELQQDEELSLFIDFAFVSCEIEDWQQLFLMSLCCSQIIANSSFSWWSAYFNIENTKEEKEKKEIYYPSKWYEYKYSHLDVSGLQVKGWQKVDF